MEDRRFVPRYPLKLSVELLGAHDERFSAQSHDISLNSIGLDMERTAVLGLAQGGTQLSPGDSVVVIVNGQGDLTITLAGRVRHVRRLSHEQYVVGVWFVDPDPIGEAALQNLVEQARQGHV